MRNSHFALMVVALLISAFCIGYGLGGSKAPAHVTLTCKPVSISYQAPNLPPIIQTVCEAH